MSKQVEKKKQRYYNDGTTTVCLLLDNDKNVIARGVSICSRLDVFDPKLGREQAKNRALEAVGRGENCGRILLHRDTKTWVDTLNLSLAIDRFGEYKGYYKPTLTPTEVLLLSGKINNSKKLETLNTTDLCVRTYKYP